MERTWLEKFYSECGREVSLAYNVLNHTNTWGISLVTAVLATSLFSAIRFNNHSIRLIYPTIYHWYIVIITWIIMLRFFVRSALALTNMYRWNELIFATAKLLSLSEVSPYKDLLERNLKKRIDAYYFRWRSPRPKFYIICQNLKLMYLWFFIIILSLFLWGIISLEKNPYFFMGIATFIITTAIEIVWYCNWHGLQYEKLDLEDEPEIQNLWQENNIVHTFHNARPILFGICLNGPFKYAYDLLINPAVKWVHLSYCLNNIEPNLMADLSKGFDIKGNMAYFAYWDENFKGKINPIRIGKIDYFKFSGKILRANVILSDLSPDQYKNKIINIDNPEHLCKYVDD